MIYFMIENKGYWLRAISKHHNAHWSKKEYALKFKTREEAERYAKNLPLPDYTISEHEDTQNCEISNAISIAKTKLSELECDLTNETYNYQKKLLLDEISELANYIKGLERASEYLDL